MSGKSSLFHLLDLSIDAPQFSTVNYCALHSLLSEILRRVSADTRKEGDLGGVSQDHSTDILELKQSVDTLQCEFKGLQEQLSQSIAPIQDHLKEIHELKESQGDLQSEFKGLQEQVSQTMVPIGDLKDIHELKEYRDSLQNELKGLQDQLSQEQFTDIHNLKKSQNVLQSELKDLQEQLSQDHFKDVHELKESRDALQNELKGLQEQLSQFMAQIQDQKKEIVELKEYRDALQSEIKGLKKKLSQRRDLELATTPPSADISKMVGQQFQPQEQHQGLMMEGSGRTVEGSEVQSLSGEGDLERGQRDSRLQQDDSSTSSSVDISKRDSQHFQGDEKLRPTTEEIGRTVEGSEMQTKELLSEHPVQASILQLQRQCEKLCDTTHLLLEGQSQQQKQIDHNNIMLQELLVKSDTQEQEWHRTTDKVYDETDRKLICKELELMKKKLDNCWEVVSKVAHAPPDSEVDNAAAIRKPLPSRFHCLSCNRRVEMSPGPKPPTLPVASSLPPHRPFPLRKVEEVYQHSQSNLGPITCAANEFHQERFRAPISVLRQGDFIQSQIVAQEPPLEQGYRKRVQSHFPPIQGTTHGTIQTVPQHEQILEVPTSQSCGNSPASTYIKHRNTRLHRALHHDKENVEILGKDGHIYKGCSSTRSLEPRPPNISKEAYSLSLRGHCP